MTCRFADNPYNRNEDINIGPLKLGVLIRIYRGNLTSYKIQYILIQDLFKQTTSSISIQTHS